MNSPKRPVLQKPVFWTRPSKTSSKNTKAKAAERCSAAFAPLEGGQGEPPVPPTHQPESCLAAPRRRPLPSPSHPRKGGQGETCSFPRFLLPEAKGRFPIFSAGHAPAENSAPPAAGGGDTSPQTGEGGSKGGTKSPLYLISSRAAPSSASRGPGWICASAGSWESPPTARRPPGTPDTAPGSSAGGGPAAARRPSRWPGCW